MTALAWAALVRPHPTAAALGNFDGVHLGHRRILEVLREKAVRSGLEPVVLTFDPHPSEILWPDKPISWLTPPREKAALLHAQGVEAVTLRFDAAVAALEGETFITDVLQKRLRGALFFLGPGHRFGKGARGDAVLLRNLVGEDRVEEIPPVVDENGETVSSSLIRRHLEAGNIDFANRMLGRAYSLRGRVVAGAQRGRGLGFPTANLALEDVRKTLPSFGVYGGTVLLDRQRIPAIANIGLRPTFGGDPKPLVEIHLLGINADLYGQTLEFELNQRIRAEKRFDSKEELQRQISEDTSGWAKQWTA